MKLHLFAPNATDEQVQRALQLAEAVFVNAGVTAERAANSEFDRDRWDRAGFPADEEPSNDDLSAAAVLDEARNVAMWACYGESMPPWGATLDVID